MFAVNGSRKMPPSQSAEALELTVDTFLTVLGQASVVCEAHHALVARAEMLRQAACALRRAAEINRRENRSIRAMRT